MFLLGCNSFSIADCAAPRESSYACCVQRHQGRNSMDTLTTQECADDELPVVARFEVRRRSYISPAGTPLRKLPVFASDLVLLAALYRAMVLARAFDLKAV